MKTVVRWEDWKDRPMPAADREYGGGTEETKFLNGTNWNYYSEFLEEFAYEYEKSVSSGLCLIDFQGWIALEEFFGQRINYKTYEDLNSYFCECDVDLLDLGGPDPLWNAYRRGDRVRWTSSDADSETAGTECVILGLVGPDEADLFDVGPMYNIRLADGRETAAFYDELSAA